MRLLLSLCALLVIAHTQAAQSIDWQFLGPSAVGEHYVDPASLQWNASKNAFFIITNVVQPDQSEWITRIKVDCGQNTYAYLAGIKTLRENVLTQFDHPRPDESISPDSMPDQLSRIYCGVPGATPAEWQSVGKSSIAEVFFDRNSIRQSEDGMRFIADTKVVPFDQQPQTISTLSFNCSDSTFTVLRLSKMRDGKMQAVFEIPKPPAPTSKTATLDKLARQFCRNIGGN